MGNAERDSRNPHCPEGKQVLRAQDKKYAGVMRTDPDGYQSKGEILEDIKVPQSKARDQEATCSAALPSPGFSVQPFGR